MLITNRQNRAFIDDEYAKNTETDFFTTQTFLKH